MLWHLNPKRGKTPSFMAWKLHGQRPCNLCPEGKTEVANVLQQVCWTKDTQPQPESVEKNTFNSTGLCVWTLKKLSHDVKTLLKNVVLTCTYIALDEFWVNSPRWKFESNLRLQATGQISRQAARIRRRPENSQLYWSWHLEFLANSSCNIHHGLQWSQHVV